MKVESICSGGWDYFFSDNIHRGRKVKFKQKWRDKFVFKHTKRGGGEMEKE